MKKCLRCNQEITIVGGYGLYTFNGKSLQEVAITHISEKRHQIVLDILYPHQEEEVQYGQRQ